MPHAQSNFFLAHETFQNARVEMQFYFFFQIKFHLHHFNEIFVVPISQFQIFENRAKIQNSHINA